MYDNIGSKIKTLAKASFAIVAIASIVGGLALLDGTDGWSLVLVFVGPLMAWISSLALYGFGELIETVSNIEQSVVRNKASAKVQTNAETARNDRLEKLRAQGLITDEEYLNALSKKS